jgi:hypothetical protein
VPKPAADDATAREIPPGVSRAMMHELHLLTRDGALNADARRKLKQIRHLVGLIEPAVRDVLDRQPSPIIVDCGAGKSYLGFLLYEMLLASAGRGELIAIEHRAELTAAAAARAARFGYDRLRFLATSIGESEHAATGAGLPERVHLVTALHACDTATDDAIALGVRRQADHIVVVPCCQAEVARQLGAAGRRDSGASAELYRHAWHRREFGSHLTNVVRALAMEAAGYQVTVTELTGWEHSMKNEVILGRRVHRDNRQARARLDAVLAEFAIEPAVIRHLHSVAAPTETT